MPNTGRRSDRIMLTIPLRVQGTDANGVPFTEDARTLVLNRHGARIQVRRWLHGGQIVRITNVIRRREADFRVVGSVGAPTEQGGEYGVEFLNPHDNIWAIQFPPPAEGGGPKALLECRKCHEAALTSVSLVEVEVLETSGILSKSCPNCGTATPWGYAEKPMAMGTGPSVTPASAETRTEAVGTRVERRRHRRIPVQLPILVRDYYGGEEITKSENLSKGGLCFCSAKNYLVGQGLLVACPYDPTAPNIQTRARIVRRQDLEGTNRKVYGAQYISESG